MIPTRPAEAASAAEAQAAAARAARGDLHACPRAQTRRNTHRTHSCWLLQQRAKRLTSRPLDHVIKNLKALVFWQRQQCPT